MLDHLKKHWPSWVICSLSVIVFFMVMISSHSFQKCMNEYDYKSSNKESDKSVAQILRSFGWTKSCAGTFLKEDGEAITAFFTLVLGISTIGLWISTRKLWEAGENQLSHAKEAFRLQFVETQNQIDVARIGATAAKDSADAAAAAERARFYIVINNHNLGDILHAFKQPPGEFYIVGKTTPPAIKFQFRNYGKTPGIIKEVSLGIEMAPEPVDPVYSVTINSFPEYMIGGSDLTGQQEFSRDPFSSEEARLISANKSRIWFFGRFDYEDVFGKPQVHRFYFRTVMWEGACVLQPYDHKHYNQST